MAKPKVYIARPVPAEVEAMLAEHCEVRKWEGEKPPGYERMKGELGDAEGLLTTGGRVDAEMLGCAPKLRAVSTISVGYNNFDLDAFRARGIIGTHTPEVLDETVADLVFALILGAARRVPELDRLVRDNRWRGTPEVDLFGMDVHHATIGIVGMGRIGDAVARRAKHGFGMQVIYCNRRRKPDAERQFGAIHGSLEELLRESDFVVLLTPLTPETEGLIDAAKLALMKPTAYLINASRGQVVVERDLIHALQRGGIRGAGLDVYEREPVEPDNPLLALPNVVMLPHIGSATAKTRFDMAKLAATNLIAALTGGNPPNVVPELRA